MTPTHVLAIVVAAKGLVFCLWQPPTLWFTRNGPKPHGKR